MSWGVTQEMLALGAAAVRSRSGAQRCAPLGTIQQLRGASVFPGGKFSQQGGH